VIGSDVNVEDRCAFRLDAPVKVVGDCGLSFGRKRSHPALIGFQFLGWDARPTSLRSSLGVENDRFTDRGAKR
jgi:hypothetical protein